MGYYCVSMFVLKEEILSECLAVSKDVYDLLYTVHFSTYFLLLLLLLFMIWCPQLATPC